MAKILVHDTTTDRIAAIDTRAREILEKWMDACADELERLEPDTHSSDGIVLAAYLTAGYSLYHNLSNMVKDQGGEVYPVPQDIPDPEDRS